MLRSVLTVLVILWSVATKYGYAYARHGSQTEKKRREGMLCIMVTSKRNTQAGEDATTGVRLLRRASYDTTSRRRIYGQDQRKRVAGSSSRHGPRRLAPRRYQSCFPVPVPHVSLCLYGFNHPRGSAPTRLHRLRSPELPPP